MRPWVDSDPYNASVWLQQQPAGASRDAAVSSFAQQVATSDPEGAAKWAETIGDTKMRQSEMERVANQWMRSNNVAAMSWIRNTNLPEDVKNRLLNVR